MAGQIQFDAQGRPFTASGYLAPIQAAEAAHIFVTDPAQRAAVNAGMDPATIQRLEAYARQNGVTAQNPSGDVPRNTFSSQNNGWDPKKGQYNTGMNWSGLGGAILGGSALGGIGAASALAGAGGAAGAGTGTATITGETGSFGAAPLGSATAASGTAAGAGAGATGAESFGKHLLNGITTPSNIAGLAGLITSLAGGAGGGGSNGGVSPEMAQAQAITNARMRRADPLHQMAVNLAASRMPTNMQLPVPNVPLPPER